MRRKTWMGWLLVVCGLASVASAQENQPSLTERGPRFLLTASPEPVRIDLARTPVLRRQISLELNDVTVDDALSAIALASGLRLMYTSSLLPSERRVRVRAEAISVAAALTEALLDADVDVLFAPNGQAAIVKRPAPPPPPPPPVVGTVAGRVSEALNGLPVAQAQVVVAGTGLGRVTDDSGRYSIVGVPPGIQQVSVRRVGYVLLTQSVTVTNGGTATLDVALQRSTTTLSEVVSTPTGQQERFKLGSAIASIGADSLVRTQPELHLEDMLQGRVPGVQVYYSGGLSGTTSPIRIRGTNSFTVSNNPIFIVDGARIEATSGASTYSASSGRLADLDVNEIESIDVVRGPSAATLYGTDAANGVIVIKTKTGVPGPAKWSVYTEQGTVQSTTVFEDLYWAYGHTPSGAQTHCLLTTLEAGGCVQDSLVKWNPFNDKSSTPMGTGTKHVYGAQVRGGVQGFNYFLSGESNNELGYLRMPDSEQQRIEQQRAVTSLPGNQIRPNYADLTNLRANIGSAINDKTHVQMSTALIFNTTSTGGSSIFSQGGYQSTPPNTVDGPWALGSGPGEVFAVEQLSNTTRFTSSVTGDHQAFSWLAMHATTGLDWSGTQGEYLQQNGQGPVSSNTGMRQDNRYDVKLWSVDLGAKATREITSSIRSVTAIGAQYNRRLEYDAKTTGTLLAPGATTLTGAATTTSTEAWIETIVAGMYLDQTFEIRDRLFLNFGLRLDGGSAFGAQFSTAKYPKAGLSWLAYDGTGGWPSWMSSLRLRTAIGSSGVQPSATQSLQADVEAPALVNGIATTGAQLSTLGNPKLKPERQTEIEAGTDAEFFNSRVKLELTAYNRQSTDAIANLMLPPSAAGFLQPLNLGVVRNRGIEALISARVVDTRAMALDLSLNGNHNQNRLITGNSAFPCSVLACNRVGFPIYAMFGYPYTYKDANGDGLIENNEVTIDTTLTYQGPQRPQTEMSATGGLGLFHERLHISAMVDYHGDYILPDGTQNNSCPIGTCQGVNDPHASLAAQAVAVAARQKFSLWGYNYNGRYARFRELSVSGQLPSAVAARIGAHGALLSVSARNLAIFMNKFPSFAAEAGGNDTNYNNPTAPEGRYLLLRLTLDY